MLRMHHVLLCLPLIVFLSPLTLSADSPAIGTLQEKGLTRSGRFFVIEKEKAVVDKWKETRAILADYSATSERKAQADQAARDFAQLEERRAELQERINELNQQINEQGFQQGNMRASGFGQGSILPQLTAQRNMVRMNIAQVVNMQKSLKPDSPTDKKALEAESQKCLEAAKTALMDFRLSVDEVTKRYDQLSSDSAVKAALHALEQGKVGSFKLGPTAPFKSVVKALENAERTVLAKRTASASRRKGRSKK